MGSPRKNAALALGIFANQLVVCCLFGLADLFVHQDAIAAERFPFKIIDQNDPGGNQPLPPPTPLGNLNTPSPPPQPSDTKQKLCEDLRKAGQVPDFCK